MLDSDGNYFPDPLNVQQVVEDYFGLNVFHSDAFKRGFEAGVQREIDRPKLGSDFGRFGFMVCPFTQCSSDYDAWFFGFGAGGQHQIYCADRLAHARGNGVIK